MAQKDLFYFFDLYVLRARGYSAFGDELCYAAIVILVS